MIRCDDWKEHGYTSKDACIRDKAAFESVFGDATVFANQIAQLTKQFNEQPRCDPARQTHVPGRPKDCW